MRRPPASSTPSSSATSSGRSRIPWRRSMRGKAAAPQGRLLLFESAWGSAADARESLLARVREKVQTAKNTPPAHHAPYPSELRESLPHGTGVSAERLVELVQSSAWGPARFERLRDVEWSIVQAKPGIERMLGAAPRFVVVAGP